MFSTGICRWLFLLVSLATWVTLTNSREMRVVCYYTNWSVYRPGDAKFSPQNINPYLCTHLIYAFGGFTKDNTIKPFDKYQDIEKGGYAKFTGLKTYNKNLKTMLAIGGWNEGSTRFSSMVASPERRKEFAKNAIKFLRLNHFDGLDLDWEYPSFRDGGKPRDKDNYSLLVQDLREEFDKEAEKTGRPRLLLTMAVPAGIEYINKGFDVPKISRYVDWMNILSYDYHSAFEPSVNHHAPLYSLEEESEYNYDSDLNIHYSIQHYLNNGADPSKLVVGIPTYGRSYTLLNPDAVDIGSPADGPGNMGEATRENGYLAYYEICENVRDHDWEVEQPNSEVMGPFAFKDDQWVGYDDEEIVKKKAEYVAEHNLGGIMFWSIDNDDFRGKCHDKPYPLIEAGRAALIAAHGVTDDNLIAPTKKPLKSRTRTRTKTSNVAVSSKDEKTEKPEKLQTRRRNRPRPSKSKQESEQETTTVRKTRRKDSKDLSTQETSSYSSLKVVTPSYTTPAPPPTPDMDGDFKCEDDGFYPHPKDCKKYYWCLSGAGDTGIIAHQFTCPAGLYFNKAADSCDYTQNVVCNKKTQKATTANQGIAPGSTTSAPSSSFFSTSRVPPKITAATSKTTFVQTTTTTTEAYEEDDEEYEDEEDEHSKKGAEEDPQVIKELIELIKKAGGLEELEKQFNTKANVTNNSEQPKTKSSLSKTLYERVLSKAIKNTPTTTPSQSTKSRNSLFRNSRGPQSEKTEDDDESTTQKKSERGKLQYTSVSRFRPSVSRDKEIEENLEDDQEIEQKTESQTGRKVTDKFPAYTNIRRSRVSTTTKTPKNDRNKILGEGPVDEDDEVEKLIDDDEDEDEDETDSINDSTTKKANIPQYVNIRRQRPSTTEEIPTSRYSEIRRGTTSTEEVPTSRYSEISRGTTSTEAPISTSTTSKYKQIRRGTTTATTKKPFTEETQFLSSNITQEVIPVTEPVSSESGLGSTISDKPSNDTSEDSRNENLLNVITTTRTYISTTDDINFVKSEANETKSTEKPNLPSKPNLFNPIQRKRPQLFEPRPFSKPTEASTKSPASQTTKVSYDFDSKTDKIVKEKPSINFRSRGSSRFNPQKTLNTTNQVEGSDIKQVTSKRRLSVTEKNIEDHRSYRPSELADLSSLTAVDFDNIKDLHAETNNRRRRPTTTTTTTQSPENLPKSPSPFKRRRININLSDLTKNSQTTERNTVTDSLQSTTRNRKIIRRFRTTASTTSSTTEALEITTAVPTTTVYVKPTKTLLDVAPSNNEVDDDNFEDASTEEYENIRLSESNIRENSDINSFGVDPKLRNKFIKSEIFGKSSVYDKTFTPDEKTSTINIDVSSTTSTEATVPTRTKKIIRKITPTVSSKIADKTYSIDTEQIFGRKRKIIRKFRPTFNRKNSTELINEELESNKTLTSNLKEPETSESTLEKDNISNLQNKEEPKVPKRIFRPRENIRRFTPVIIVEPESTSPKYSQKNKTVLLRGPNRNYRPKFNITTSTTESTARTQKYSFVPRRTNKLQTSSTTTTTKATSQQPITTTESDEYSEDTDTTTLADNSITAEIETYNPTSEQTTTEYGTTEENTSSETTKTTETDNINSIYTEIPTTMIIDAETTTIKSEEPEFTTESFDLTTDASTDTTTAIDMTSFTPISSTEAPQQSTVEYKSNILRPIESRPKYIPSKLKNLSVNENTEASGLKPRINYRNRLQSSTTSTTTPTSTTEKENDARFSPKSNKRFNKFRPSNRNEDLKSQENSSPLSINKTLYKYKRPKSIKQETKPEEIDEENIEDNADSGSVSKKLLNNKNAVTQETDEILKLEDGTEDVTAGNKPDEEKADETKKLDESTVNTEEPGITGDLKDITTESISITTVNEVIQINEKPIEEKAPELHEEINTLNNVPDVVNDIKTNDEMMSTTEYSPNTITIVPIPLNKTYYLNPNVNNNITKDPETTETFIDIDSDAVKTRNKNVFNNQKPNSEGNGKESIETNVDNSSVSNSFYKYKNPLEERNPKSYIKVEIISDDIEEKVGTFKRKYSPNISSATLRPSNKPFYLRSGFPKPVTEDSKTNEGLKDIDTDAVKTRNKNLFSNRKPNSNLSNPEEVGEDTANNSSSLTISKVYNRYKKPKKDETSKLDEGVGDESDLEKPVDNKKDTEDKIKTSKRKYVPNVSSTTLRPSNKPYYLKPSLPTEELKDIDTDAVRTRNKNLFNNRKANFNIFSHSTTYSTATTEESTVPPTTVVPEEASTYIDAETTYNTSPQPIESTTLLHVFAEKEEKLETNKTNESTTNKVERLIEVNRIVSVKTKEDKIKNHHVEHVTDEESSILDKIGAINRVTNIKIVDQDGKLVNNNETNYAYTTESPIKSSVDMIIQIAKIEEVTAKNLEKINLTSISVDVNTPATSREDRKLDLVGSKIDYSKHQSDGKAEIFGGLSQINIITPRSVHLTESSTIALEGLFQTEKPNLFTSKNSINEELLETENSKFVNIRVLHPDEGYRTNKKIFEEPKVIPIKILKQDDDIVRKAKVVEVSTKSQFNMFKIVPIKVETAKRLPPPLPLIRINRQYN